MGVLVGLLPSGNGRDVGLIPCQITGRRAAWLRPTAKRVIETFTRLRTPLNIALELPTVETIKKSVRMGMGIAFAPRMCVEDELARGEFVSVRVKEIRIQRKLRLIYRRHAALSAAAKAFLDIAQELAATPNTGENSRQEGVSTEDRGWPSAVGARHARKAHSLTQEAQGRV